MLMAVMLTTIDNPFDPFEQFDEWYAYDVSKGYNTCGYLARIVNSSPELSDTDDVLAIEQAMKEIVDINLLGIYKLVSKDVE
jgi:hypothetical protein